MWSQILSIFSIINFLFYTCNEAKPNYCIPSDTNCWPKPQEISALSNSLNGQLVTSSSNPAVYESYIKSGYDALFWQYPSFIVVCLSAQDIQSAVTFASSHNIQISIYSTGHSYSGRNTANNSVQINLSKMAKYQVAKDASTITVETGMHWKDIYEIVDFFDRIIIGGSDPDVGPGGYSLGGGHSPITPQFGLSSDYTTEYYMVDAQSNIVRIYNTSGKNQTIDDLFWSLKGGGGSTFGVIINITFALHVPETQNKFTRVSCYYNWFKHPLSEEGFIGDYILQNYFELIVTEQLDEHWGGYMLSGGNGYIFTKTLYANVSYGQQNAKLLTSLSYPYNTSLNTHCSVSILDTFWDYESQIGPEGPGNLWLFNSLVVKNNLTKDYATDITAMLNISLNKTAGFGCGINIISQGGETNKRDDDFTAVTPAFRHNWVETAFGCAWAANVSQEIVDNAVAFSNKYEMKLREYGMGIYSNEENPQCYDCDWKQQFWGSHYNKLLKVKKRWDPNQVFWCSHCVGSDL
eukprot:325228_1